MQSSVFLALFRPLVLSCTVPSFWQCSCLLCAPAIPANASSLVIQHMLMGSNGVTQDPSLSLVFEYAEHDLYEMVRCYRERTAFPPGGGFGAYTLKSLMWQLIAGTHALHDARIMHRDLKPSNVLVMGEGVQQGQVKIADFGLARCAALHVPLHCMQQLWSTHLSLGTTAGLSIAKLHSPI